MRASPRVAITARMRKRAWRYVQKLRNGPRAKSVNGSSFSKRSFLEWIRGGIFIPVEGVKVEIGEVEHCSTLPEPTCNECIKKWEASGLQKDIKCHLMRQLSDIRGLVCS